MSTEDTTTITPERLAELEDAERILDALRDAGVHEWDGYETTLRAIAEGDTHQLSSGTAPGFADCGVWIVSGDESASPTCPACRAHAARAAT